MGPRSTASLTLAALAALVAGLVLTACGERPQSRTEPGPRKGADTRPSTGAQAAYTAAGWQAGDDASWQNQIRARTQGQNEYSRVQSSSPSATGGVVAAPMPATMPAPAAAAPAAPAVQATSPASAP